MIRKLSSRGKLFNDSTMIATTRQEVDSIETSLIVKIRNVIFIDSLLYARRKVGTDVFRLRAVTGPLYIPLSNDEYYSVWSQIMGNH